MTRPAQAALFVVGSICAIVALIIVAPMLAVLAVARTGSRRT